MTSGTAEESICAAMVKKIRTTLNSYPHGGKRYYLGTAVKSSKTIWSVLIKSPMVDTSIGIARFNTRGAGRILEMPTDEALSKTIMEELHFMLGVK